MGRKDAKARTADSEIRAFTRALRVRATVRSLSSLTILYPITIEELRVKVLSFLFGKAVEICTAVYGTNCPADTFISKNNASAIHKLVKVR